MIFWVARCWILEISFANSTIHHPPSTIHHPPIHHPPSTIHHHHPPSTIHHPPSTIHHPPSTIHLQLLQNARVVLIGPRVGVGLRLHHPLHDGFLPFAEAQSLRIPIIAEGDPGVERNPPVG